MMLTGTMTILNKLEILLQLLEDDDVSSHLMMKGIEGETGDGYSSYLYINKITVKDLKSALRIEMTGLINAEYSKL